MGVLCDWQLKDAIYQNKLVDPFDPACLNPASIDLRVGEKVRLQFIDPMWLEWQNLGVPYREPLPSDKLWAEPQHLGEGYLLKQGETILLDTMEYVRIPNHLMAEMWLKSSAGRNGLDIYKAGYIDPGFEGTLTFRLTNNVRRPWLVVPGQRLVQMVVREMSRVPQKSYQQTGRYGGQTGPTVARGTA